MNDRAMPRIRAPQDFWSGLVLLAFAGGAWVLASGLSGMHGSQLGAGTTVRLFIFLLAVSAAVVMLRGLVHDGAPLSRVAIRGPFAVIAAVLFFSFGVRPLGLAIASFGTTFLAALASREIRWHESVILSAILAAFAVGAFHFALNLPIPLWPRF